MSRGIALALGISVAAASAPALAQVGQQVPQGWFKVCSKQADIDVCNVQNIITAETGQLVTGVSLIEIKGKVSRKVFQVTVPTGRMVPPGVGMQIDSGKVQKVDYMICFPDRCVAEVGLNDQLVNALKKGTNLTLTSINFQNRPNPIKVSLQGFSGAFDGPAMKPADIDERQKQVQDFATKKSEEFQKKLQDAQEAAKDKPAN